MSQFGPRVWAVGGGGGLRFLDDFPLIFQSFLLRCEDASKKERMKTGREKTIGPRLSYLLASVPLFTISVHALSTLNTKP